MTTIHTMDGSVFGRLLVPGHTAVTAVGSTAADGAEGRRAPELT